MGVDRLPSGSYRARLMVDGKTYSATFATEEEAAEWVVVTRGRVVEARTARSPTVEEYAHRWLGEFIDTTAGIDHDRRDLVEHILPAVGARPMVEVSTAEIVTLLEQVGADTSEAAADQVRVTLRELVVDAVDERLIGRSPMPASQRAAAAPPHGDIH